MKLPFTIEGLYTTRLSFNEMINELENKSPIKYFSGLRVDKYSLNVIHNIFYIQRNSYGLNALLEYFPLIEAEVVNQNPTRVHLKLSPSYLSIIFFAFFVIAFGIGGIFVDNWTINGVRRAPTFIERIVIVFFGSVIPFLWCYFQTIRPIKKAHNWIIEKLELIEHK